MMLRFLRVEKLAFNKNFVVDACPCDILIAMAVMAKVDLMKDKNIYKYFGYVINVPIGYRGMVCVTDVNDRAER